MLPGPAPCVCLLEFAGNARVVIPQRGPHDLGWFLQVQGLCLEQVPKSIMVVVIVESSSSDRSVSVVDDPHDQIEGKGCNDDVRFVGPFQAWLWPDP